MTSQNEKYRRGGRAGRAEEHEFPKGKAGLVLCRVCNIVYFKKSWHHNLRRHPNLREDLHVSFTICPACRTIQNKQYEGRITIKNIPSASRANLAALIHAFTTRAYQKDPLDRLIQVKETRAGLEVATTENQLATKLAKKICEVFKKGIIRIAYSHGPAKVADVTVTFPSP